ncbi:GAF sensor hybrid histidine kinase [Sulfitobacter guttiformis KCTC 32187]|uniref:histidine kinase n=2 Tax=Sulfitobacter guttiformis TaxID=74349 RepID=A0A420DUG8_9RHOB|nr:GAF sensor hybrid histidine kinase [Sulfitobacter guttiformis KCTC 32187]RKE97902.1 signal transduction histidine kinase [Sulfitobacter guttiformis]
MAKTYTFEALGLLHGSMDEGLLNINTLATRVFGVAVSFVSVLERQEGRQYMSAHSGSCFDDPDLHDIPIEGSICQYVQVSQQTVAIPDLLKDARTRNSELISKTGMRSYLGSPIHTTAGKVIGAICCMDESPRNWTQDEIGILEGMARCVDDIVSARTSALEENKARIELQEIMETRSGYIAHVSHEIRTPLTGIIGSIKLLKGAKSEKQLKSLMSILDRSADKLQSFVNDILDLAKLDAGYFEIVKEEMDIGKLASDILSEFTALVDTKSISLSVKNQLDENLYFADRTAFQTILQNLIGNAIKFTDTGSVTVSIGEDSYGQVAIKVIDTGIGIAPEHHEKIFKEFQQAESVTARTYGGTGLGMSIVKRMVERMEGTISVKSQLGQGSTFLILVPLELAAQRKIAA